MFIRFKIGRTKKVVKDPEVIRIPEPARINLGLLTVAYDEYGNSISTDTHELVRGHWFSDLGLKAKIDALSSMRVVKVSLLSLRGGVLLESSRNIQLYPGDILEVKWDLTLNSDDYGKQGKCKTKKSKAA